MLSLISSVPSPISSYNKFSRPDRIFLCPSTSYAVAAHYGSYDQHDEVEMKLLTKKPETFSSILKHLEPWTLGKTWQKDIHSIYFDTPDLKLNQHQFNLRLRFRIEEDNQPAGIMVSFKTRAKNPDSYDSVHVRKEFEAHLPELRLDLNPLRQQFHQPEVHQLFDLIGGKPQQLRELFDITCQRTGLKIMLPIVSEKNTSRVLTPEALLKQPNLEYKKAVYEFALDRNHFYLPGHPDKPIYEDSEIEAEFKAKPCNFDYSGNHLDSSPDLTRQEILAGMSFIRHELENAAGPLTGSNQCKQQRGFTAWEKQGQPFSDPRQPTLFGQPIAVSPIQGKKGSTLRLLA